MIFLKILILVLLQLTVVDEELLNSCQRAFHPLPRDESLYNGIYLWSNSGF